VTVGEALRSMERLQPDALLVDIGLPDGDGLELAGRLAGLPWRPHVLVISTDPDGADDATIRQLGVAGFIPKSELPSPAAQRLLDDAR
jgi:DNA-binding NarL/FixJ family response regulator